MTSCLILDCMQTACSYLFMNSRTQIENVVTGGKIALQSLQIYYCIACRNCHHFQLKNSNKFHTQYKNIENWQASEGCIFAYILQQFVIKFWNFTTFRLLPQVLSGNFIFASIGLDQRRR